jgi:oxygen-independent coproporphyrinogen-3 oxidase
MSFGLYLHYPFCHNRCAYCDFYKEQYDAAHENEFYSALTVETELAARQYGAVDGEIKSIFIGGGTPSLTDPELLSSWLDRLKSLFNVAVGIEFSIECNPESVELDSLRTLIDLGVNRPVFGIQSFHPASLRLLDRRHEPRDSHRAIYYAHALGVENIGCDLIFGLPGQNLRVLTVDLEQLIDLGPAHISYYQLTVEPGTVLAARVDSGEVRCHDNDMLHAMYRTGCEKMATAGYRRYEVSSFARPGFECRHNQGYWDGSSYLGLGPSAHSFMQDKRWANTPDLREYVRSVQAGAPACIEDPSGRKERIEEAIMLGLRTAGGVGRFQFAQRFDCEPEEYLDPRQLDLLTASGHLVRDELSVRLSDLGMNLADEITRRLVK